ncbi:hypothetical protein BJ912DRAFT_1093543 [Pholiota molesta]|nr:hypothetical protein BJ912DRAFT_1093543 [Pholiota molesta]
MFLNVVRGHRCRMRVLRLLTRADARMGTEFKLRFAELEFFVDYSTCHVELLNFNRPTSNHTSAASLTTRLIKIRPSKYGDQGVKKKGKTRRERDLKGPCPLPSGRRLTSARLTPHASPLPPPSHFSDSTAPSRTPRRVPLPSNEGCGPALARPPPPWPAMTSTPGGQRRPTTTRSQPARMMASDGAGGG